MKNNLVDLNNYLFEELERLNDDEALTSEEVLERELKRSKAITEVSAQIVQIVQNAKVMLEAKKHSDTFGYGEEKFYSSKNETKMIENNPYKDMAKKVENQNNVSREEFKDRLLFEMDKPKL